MLVAFEARQAGADALFTYWWDGVATPGDAYLVPLAGRTAIGYVIEVFTSTEEELGFPVGRLKAMGEPVKGLSLTSEMICLLQWMAREYVAPLTVCLSLATAPGARTRIGTTWSAREDSLGKLELTSAQHEVLGVLRSSGPILETPKKPLVANSKRILRALVGKDLVERRSALILPAEQHRLKGRFALTDDADLIENFLRKQAKKKPAQAMVLIRMGGSGRSGLQGQEIKALCGATDQTIRALLAANLLQPVEVADPEPDPSKVLNADQGRAVAAIVSAVQQSRHEAFLLHGVTGSGKTEVYLRASEAVLAQGRRVLYLVPEIALTAQVITQLRSRFGSSVAVLHSNLEVSDRLDNWTKIRSGTASVILGPRSAVFSPISGLGLVIVDEEHDGSYKQESSPRYHARSVAVERARAANVPIVLGSATPSIESFHRAQQGELTLLRLPCRAAEASLPQIRIVDLRDQYQIGSPSLLSPELQEDLGQAIHSGHQAILFLNRRAYASFLICRECGFQVMCSRCSVTLSVHRTAGLLKCHQCDFQMPIPATCPSCGGTRIKPFGAGTQRVEETVLTTFPGVRVARLDRDVAQRKGAVEQILANLRSGETQVLVGTQMVAKGFDFPNVTLVGVVAADVSLGLPDFRASERTYQILCQVAGRAGRAKHAGAVVIQTFHPEHPAIVAAAAQDEKDFYAKVLDERRSCGYPPFVRLINILVTNRDRQDAIDRSALIAKDLRTRIEDGEILGPTDCVIERLHGNWRRQILLKLPSHVAVPEWLMEYTKLDTCTVTVDVDPNSMI